MIAAVRSLLSLLLGVAMLLAGGGLLGTLIAVRGGVEGWNEQVVGLVMSAYFVGFFLGTFTAPGLIRRIGHIRSFAFYACLCASVVLLHPVIVDPWAWALFRLLTGAALVGLYTVIESWLNASAPPEQRAQVFALYMTINLFALAAGQWLLGIFPPSTFIPFSLVAILVCLAALPVTASRMTQPEVPAAVRLRLLDLVRLAPAASGGALLGGIVLGAYWGMAPVYAASIGLDLSGISALLSLTIVGGALLQLPIGRFSDGRDRRTTLVIISLGAALLTAGMSASMQVGPWLLCTIFFFYGGLTFAIYPLCVAHLIDHLSADDVLVGGSSLLLMNGIGSALGPALAGILMKHSGATALPGFFAGTLVLLALVAGGRRLLRRRGHDDATEFQLMLRTTPSALELLADEEDVGEQGD